MAARCFQKMQKFSSCKIEYESYHSNPDSGYSERVPVDQCAKLPPRKMTDLAMQLKAGVPLEQVNSMLLDPVGTVHLGSSDKADDKESSKSEV